MENKSVVKTYLYPIFILVVITGIVAIMLSFTKDLTNPIIAANAKKEADAARSIVLEKADSFQEITLDDALKTKYSITEAYAADNGVGMVIMVATPGYAGLLPIMVGINADATVNKIQVMPNEETAGIGKKVEADSFSSQFSGANASSVESKVSAISGATISSKATILAVTNALEVFAQLNGGKI